MTKVKTLTKTPKYVEWNRLKNLDYMSGLIYFSGEGFSNVIIFGQTKKDYNNIKMCFDRISIGSVITFENVIYRDKKGFVRLPNQQFKL